MGITCGSQDLEDTVVDGKERYIEGSTTEIIYDDLRLTALLVETIGDGGSGWFVNDTKNLKTGDSSGILGCLTLSIVEVCKMKSI
jgi:NAD-specific glutamate dehydrogenase